jgi:Flp pilus assembly protein TadG
MRRRGEAGASAVEFALVLPLLLVLVFGIIEFGLAFNRQQAFHAASREAARLVAVGYDLGVVRQTVLDQASSTVGDQADISVTVISPCNGSGDPDDLVTVRVELSNPGPYAIRIPFVPQSNPTYRSDATFRCEVQP